MLDQGNLAEMISIHKGCNDRFITEIIKTLYGHFTAYDDVEFIALNILTDNFPSFAELFRNQESRYCRKLTIIKHIQNGDLPQPFQCNCGDAFLVDLKS